MLCLAVWQRGSLPLRKRENRNKINIKILKLKVTGNKTCPFFLTPFYGACSILVPRASPRCQRTTSQNKQHWGRERDCPEVIPGICAEKVTALTNARSPSDFSQRSRFLGAKQNEPLILRLIFWNRLEKTFNVCNCECLTPEYHKSMRELSQPVLRDCVHFDQRQEP